MLVGILANEYTLGSVVSGDHRITHSGRLTALRVGQGVAVMGGAGLMIVPDLILEVVGWLWLVCGIGLVAVNVSGVGRGLRNPEIYAERGALYKRLFHVADIDLSAEDVRKRLDDRGCRAEEYLVRANDAISRGIAHYWASDGEYRYNLTVPWRENWVLHVGSVIYPEVYRKYEFCDPWKALERGVGKCSQASVVMAEIARRRGYRSVIVSLAEHVVTMIEVGRGSRVWWVFDPDFGVVIPYDMATIHAAPSLIEPYYAARGYDGKVALFALPEGCEDALDRGVLSAGTRAAFASAGFGLGVKSVGWRMADGGWRIRDGGQTWGVETIGGRQYVYAASIDDLVRAFGRPYKIRRNVQEFRGKDYVLEKLSYLGKWMIPVGLLLGGALCVRRPRGRQEPLEVGRA